MKQILLTILVPVVSLLASSAHAQREPPPNHDKLSEVMEWRIGEWKATKATLGTGEAAVEVSEPQATLKTVWALDGQIQTTSSRASWLREDGSKRSLNREYTHYWDRSDQKIKVVWFSSWGTVRHGVLENVVAKKLTWKWPIDRDDGRKGTAVAVEILQDDGSMVVEATRKLDDGTLLSFSRTVFEKTASE